MACPKGSSGFRSFLRGVTNFQMMLLLKIFLRNNKQLPKFFNGLYVQFICTLSITGAI